MRESSHHSSERNLLLRSLSDARYDAIAGTIDRISVSAKTVLFEAGDALHSVYFPQSGFISLVVPLDNGSAVEAVTVGFDGLVGLSAYFGERTSLTRAISQVEGIVHRLPVEPFLRLVAENDTLRRRIHQYAQLRIDMLAQSSACNRAHSIEQRCARWLLISQDRAQTSEFALTHEFLAEMIGVRRPSVTAAARGLQAAGLISYNRGVIHILDRLGLEKAACECYRRVRARELKLFLQK
jgi:CRP-like cAMP-binding protein